MFGSLVMTGRVAALIVLFVVPCAGAFAQGTAPIDGTRLQSLCDTFTSSIGPITANYSFKNWEGTPQSQAVTFVPLTASCVTNQPHWFMQFEKRSGMAPPTKIRFKFEKQGTDYVLSGISGKADCYEAISKWFVAYWRNEGAQLKPENVEAMNYAARDRWCPAMVDAASTAILKRINSK